MLDRLAHARGQLVQALARDARHAVDSRIEARRRAVGHRVHSSGRQADAFVERAGGCIGGLSDDAGFLRRLGCRPGFLQRGRRGLSTVGVDRFDGRLLYGCCLG